eukprot:9468799-Pyramimonas_sp.AAC.1
MQSPRARRRQGALRQVQEGPLHRCRAHPPWPRTSLPQTWSARTAPTCHWASWAKQASPRKHHIGNAAIA